MGNAKKEKPGESTGQFKMDVTKAYLAGANRSAKTPCEVA